ncbi:Adenine nucleotide alpha hydrolases-like protein [Pleurostoma richardsiae]|uniref:tRNA(Ile)-lysidine synthetase n=1 Tax=Pleurostoma richardsiae TaxID=41990 RepID=A0AA38VHM6_9PEZI|nr:Adenine nucleotide alpha hydrolases-like protein [Pleurostoma richardsiae]
MGSIPHVLHTSARAISRAEFVDAVRATCPPRYPLARGTTHRPIGLAISGGVDSMALAWLCYNAKRCEPSWKIADNPVSNLYGFVIDHALRDESATEAQSVVEILRSRMGFRAEVTRINWQAELGEAADPKALTNFESLARRARYRKFGRLCAARGIVSLFLAHHQDDQYETVMMRLLQGHGPAGLRGMRVAGDIPECHDIFGAYGSGFVDDQQSQQPFWNLRPSKHQKQSMRAEMKAEIPAHLLARERSAGRATDSDRYLYDEYDKQLRGTRWLTPLAPLDVEEGGLFVYRPLLEFSKDRLIATCLENNVPWFEDSTNQDRTLTLRNAVRHVYRNYRLPVALQKPSVLQLSKRCDARARAQEAEVDRLLSRTVVRDFEPNVGTVLIRMPEFSVESVRRGLKKRSPIREEMRRNHLRSVASLFVQRILAIVTPDYQLTPAANLQQVVSRLFPALEGGQRASEQPPKAFNICGVHFLPIRPAKSDTLYWYLTREPYASNVPIPAVYFKPLKEKLRRWDTFFTLRFSPWTLWDGRFWIRVVNQLKVPAQVAPFNKEHAKPFREALLDDNERDRLAALLKRHAPGKVRYTLPAIYIASDKDWAVHAHTSSRRTGTGGQGTTRPLTNTGEDGLEAEDVVATSIGGTKKKQARTLVALPTLGVYLPGIDHWLHWEVRYRRVDAKTFVSSVRSEQQLKRRKRIILAALRGPAGKRRLRKSKPHSDTRSLGHWRTSRNLSKR